MQKHCESHFVSAESAVQNHVPDAENQNLFNATTETKFFTLGFYITGPTTGQTTKTGQVMDASCLNY